MTKLYTFAAGVLALLSTFIPVSAALAQSDPGGCRSHDSLQLVSLYNSTGGANWLNKWDLSKPIDTWHGITLDANGCVWLLDLRGNNLSGPLPDLNLPKLNLLNLSHNNLSGCIPESLRVYCGLSYRGDPPINISGNPNLPVQDFYSFCSSGAGSCDNAFNLPDLTLANLTITNTTDSLFKILTFKFDVKNMGNADASGPFTIKSYLSKDTILSAEDYQDGVIPTGGFSVGLTATQVKGALTLPAGVAPGSYYLIVKVDADNQIAESNENNNVIVSKFPFTVTSGGGVGVQFCDSRSKQQWELWVKNVQLNTINNTSGQFRDYHSPGYSNYTDLSTNLAKGQTFDLKVTPGVASVNELPNVYCRAWIDFNNDNIFQDNEKVLEGTAQSMFAASIAIPANAAPGARRMRVSMKMGAYPAPCEIFDKGEVEDYSVTIVDSTFINSGCRFQDSLQLVALYNATNGANWTKPWDLTKPIDTWNGIYIDTTGCLGALSLDNNNLQGTLPNLSMSKLYYLSLDGNQLSGSVPNFNLPALKFLYLIGNQLSGALPDFNMPYLQQLWVNSNQLSGPVPNFNLPNLVYLNLYDNRFTGSIPNFNLPKLTSLLLGANQLTGSVPSFNLPALTYLDLQHNQLSGSLPIFNLPNLTDLYLSNNQLSGCIPTYFEYYCGKKVDISGNPNLATQDFAAFCSNNVGTCINSADGNLIITHTGGAYRQFQTLTFQLTFKNTGTSVLNNITINFPFPDKTVNGGTATATAGFWQEYCPGGVHCYQWTIPALAPGITAMLDVPLYVQNATGAIIGNARVTGSTPGLPGRSATTTVGMADAGTANLSASKPVLDFEARTELDKAHLMWISGAARIDYFEIQRLDDRGVWQTVGNQKARAANLGAVYTLTDDALAEGSHFYQVKAVGLDGSVQISAIKEVKTGDWNDARVFPNPAADELTLSVKNFAGKAVQLCIYNGVGVLVKTLNFDEADDYQATTNISALPVGNYYLRAAAAGKRDVARRFTIIR